MTSLKSLISQPIDDEFRLCCRNVAFSERKACLNVLTSQGYYGLLSNADMDSLKAEFLSSGDVNNDLFSDHTNRVCFIDCENIAEGEITPSLTQLLGLLAHIHVRVNSFSALFIEAQQNYLLKLDDFDAILWTINESSEAKDDWLLAGDRIIKALNLFLDTLGCEEKLYYQFTGNDTLVVLLNAEMRDTLLNFAAVSAGVCL